MHINSHYCTADLPRKPLHTQPAPYPGHSAATTAYPHTYASPHTCEAVGCYKPVHYDPTLGYFSYCSPQCRDEHLLPDYNKKLKADIAKFEADPPTDYMQSSSSSSSFKKTDSELVRQFVIEKKSREPLGIIFARKDATKVSICTLYRHNIHVCMYNIVCTHACTGIASFPGHTSSSEKYSDCACDSNSVFYNYLIYGCGLEAKLV